MRPYLLLLAFLIPVFCFAQKSFRFAFISDTHIGSPNGGAEEDLRRTVADINAMKDLAFVVLTGDITELGTNEELKTAKRILDSLHIKYYIIPGNHDTGWSESGGLEFTRTFGSDKFHFTYQSIHFLGCPSGPYVRMSDGHVPRGSVNWLNGELKEIGKNEPVVFLNHYPLDNGLDNWYEVIDALKTKNTILALCGHGHSNRPVKAEEIPAVMGRSNLRAKEAEGGYNIVTIDADSIRFVERRPLSGRERRWTGLAFKAQDYANGKKFPRPDFAMNDTFEVQAAWTYQSGGNVIATPALTNGLVVFGNEFGEVEALDKKSGKKVWTFKAKGPVYSSPAADAGLVVFGATDSFVYALDAKKGKLKWKQKTGASVLGSPLIENGTVYIGGSDHHFRAYELQTGTLKWASKVMKGPMMSRPVIEGDRIVFGAWDRNLYCLDKNSGSLLWTWNNGSSVINFSPAACIPVIVDSTVFVVAPDRYLSAIDLASGATLWRTNEATIRESLGGSADGQWIYGKTMNDTVVVFPAARTQSPAAWKLHAGYGYEHAPSMLIEKEGQVYFGTRNGVVYAIDPVRRAVQWKYKIDNSMVNTVLPLGKGEVLAATMDGKVSLLVPR